MFTLSATTMILSEFFIIIISIALHPLRYWAYNFCTSQLNLHCNGCLSRLGYLPEIAVSIPMLSCDIITSHTLNRKHSKEGNFSTLYLQNYLT